MNQTIGLKNKGSPSLKQKSASKASRAKPKAFLRSVSIFDTIKNMTTSHIIDNNNNNNNDNKKLLNSMKDYIKDNVKKMTVKTSEFISYYLNCFNVFKSEVYDIVNFGTK